MIKPVSRRPSEHLIPSIGKPLLLFAGDIQAAIRNTPFELSSENTRIMKSHAFNAGWFPPIMTAKSVPSSPLQVTLDVKCPTCECGFDSPNGPARIW